MVIGPPLKYTTVDQGQMRKPVDGKPYVHAHVSVGTREYQTRAGHLGEATVRPTLELFLTQLNGELIREKDPNTGLEGLQP